MTQLSNRRQIMLGAASIAATRLAVAEHKTPVTTAVVDSEPRTPAELMSRYIMAFNRWDVAGVMALHTPDVRVYTYPPYQIESDGYDAVKATHAGWFKTRWIGIEMYRAILGESIAVHYLMTDTKGKHLGNALSTFRWRAGRIDAAAYVYAAIGEGTQGQACQQQMTDYIDSFNRRDLDAVMALHTQDVKVYTYFPPQIESDGYAAVKAIHHKWFFETPWKALEVYRAAIGDSIIVHYVLFNADDKVTGQGMCTFHYRDGKIDRADYIYEAAPKAAAHA